MSNDSNDLSEMPEENSYDKHKLAKMILAAGAAWLAGHVVDAVYENIRQRRTNRTDENETE